MADRWEQMCAGGLGDPFNVGTKDGPLVTDDSTKIVIDGDEGKWNVYLADLDGIPSAHEVYQTFNDYDAAVNEAERLADKTGLPIAGGS